MTADSCSAVQELATAVQHGIALITIVFNNNQYGNVQQMQRTLYGNRVIASDLRNPDLPDLQSPSVRVDCVPRQPDALGRALQDSLAASEPTVIEVPCGDMPDVDVFRKLPRVRGERAARSMSVNAPLDEGLERVWRHAVPYLGVRDNLRHTRYCCHFARTLLALHPGGPRRGRDAGDGAT